MFQAVLFDLDGTLLDTLADLANSMNAALKRLGFATHPVDSYRYFVGDGTECLARRVLPGDRLDEETVSKSLALMRDEYSRRWADTTTAYDGIGELLTGLEEMGLPKAVLSNKSDEFTKLTVKSLLADWSFEIVRGISDSVAPKPDPAGALQIAEELQIEPGRFLYLGDTNTDMQTADAAGMYAVGALWGFRDAQELAGSGAKALAQRPQDVLDIINNNRKS